MRIEDAPSSQSSILNPQSSIHMSLPDPTDPHSSHRYIPNAGEDIREMLQTIKLWIEEQRESKKVLTQGSVF